MSDYMSGDMSINEYMRLVNQQLVTTSIPKRADYATCSHYYSLGKTPNECVDIIMAARGSAGLARYRRACQIANPLNDTNA